MEGDRSRAKSTGEAGGGAPSKLPRLGEDNISNILHRLPAKSVLRCGAVCRSWRRLTTDPAFLAAHARRRPADVVLYTYHYDGPSVDVSLDLVPVSSDEAGRRRLMRYPHRTHEWLLLASSHGVLLFKKGEELYALCNPTTRQWARLPHLPRTQNITRTSDRAYAFYLDTPSGEFRLLCRRNLSTDGTWCILSTGAQEPRPVDMHAAEAAGITQLVPCLRATEATHVSLHGSLHWPPRRPAAATIAGQTSTEMVVFDMSSETFSLMAGPPTTTETTKLFDMEGMLVVADFGNPASTDLWFMEDYHGSRSWELRHRVPVVVLSSFGVPLTPSNLLSVAAASDREGNVMLGNHEVLAVYNVTSKTVKIIDDLATPRNATIISRYVFKESLVQHPGFVAAAQSSIDLASVHYC